VLRHSEDKKKKEEKELNEHKIRQEGVTDSLTVAERTQLRSPGKKNEAKTKDYEASGGLMQVTKRCQKGKEKIKGTLNSAL